MPVTRRNRKSEEEKPPNSEIDLDKISKITGMDITIVTNTESDEEAFDLLKEFGMPFSENVVAKKEVKEERKVETSIDYSKLDESTLKNIIKQLKSE